MKHVGKMKNNNAKIVIVYKTLPGDPKSALVVGTSVLPEVYHNSLMSLIQEPSAQQAFELAEVLSVRKFPDGNNMLSWLHVNGHLKKVPTNSVLATPNTQTSIQLDELNVLIAEQRGVKLEDLAINDGSNKQANAVEETEDSNSTSETIIEPVKTVTKPTAAELRAKAESLIKEAELLKKEADLLDAPVKKAKTKKTSSALELSS
jgi:hypothetical protein